MTEYDKLVQELRQLAKETDLVIITAVQQRPLQRRYYTVAEHCEAMEGVIFIDHIGLLRHNHV